MSTTVAVDAQFADPASLRATRILAIRIALAAPIPTDDARLAHEAHVSRCQSRDSDERGSSHDRRIRSHYLVRAFGNGETCPCVHCGRLLTPDAVSADRIYPGAVGGKYIRGNLWAACMSCNCSRRDTPWREVARAWGIRVGSIKVKVAA